MTLGLFATQWREMRPVNAATAAPANASGLTLEIEETVKKQDHASRQCKPIGAPANACICAGNSRYLAWLAGFTYIVRGRLPPDLAKDHTAGRLWVRVFHDEQIQVKNSVGDYRHVGRLQLIEYFQLQGAPPTLKSRLDCLGNAHEYNRIVSCGLLCDRTVEAWLVVHSGLSPMPDPALESATLWTPKEGTINLTSTLDPLPFDASFQSPASASASNRKSISAQPDHCKDGGDYIDPADGGRPIFEEVKPGERVKPGSSKRIDYSKRVSGSNPTGHGGTGPRAPTPTRLVLPMRPLD